MKNNDLEKIKVIIWPGFWTRLEVADHLDKIFLFGDNYHDKKYVPTSTQAVIRGLPNAIGIITKYDRCKEPSSYLNNNHLGWFKRHLNIKEQEIKELIKKENIRTIVLPENGLGTEKALLKQKAPLLFEYLNNWLENLENNLNNENKI